MKHWFNEGESGFVMFGGAHILSLFFIFLVVLVMYVFRSRLSDVSYIKKILLTGLVLSEVTYHYWAVYNEMWTEELYLPLQLCSLNILLCIVLVITENKKLFAFVYLFGFTGALQGLLTPELYQEPWHFRFLQYFLAHGLIVWTAMYYAIVRSFRISWSRFFISFIWLNVYAGCVFIVNVMLNANYMFLMRKPGNASLMDFLGPYPWYILVLEGVAFCLSLIVFLPIKKKTTMNKNQDHPPIEA
ncbi:TIGR02206 family membrane protein [Fictibacillus nanhaiensis]|uniref:YwaF family protein n=1 Tax=Fictibacillus nanhaiensis TaxID=742169 RepID=UPI001C96771D|nr:TIGR02206 family membrane protein [Fictibacillus nanhaiensis]MBY6038024.1 TIGR02206 family membrane protein [Fictibacillus nanhaiensis]